MTQAWASVWSSRPRTAKICRLTAAKPDATIGDLEVRASGRRTQVDPKGTGAFEYPFPARCDARRRAPDQVR